MNPVERGDLQAAVFCRAAVASWDEILHHGGPVLSTVLFPKFGGDETRGVLFDPTGRYETWECRNTAGTLLGWAAFYRFHDRPGYAISAECAISVRPEWKACGIGTALLEILEQRARAKGIRTLVGVIPRAHRAALSWFWRSRFITRAEFTESALGTAQSSIYALVTKRVCHD